MKEHRSNKSYNSRLTRWVYLLLPFDFNIEHIPGAKKKLVDYISRQPNQEAKVTNQNDGKFAVETITRIGKAIAAIYIDTTPQNCQLQHINSVNHTHSTRVSIAQQTNHSKLLSALNLRTTQLLLSHSANAAQIHPFNNSIMSTSYASPKTPPTPATSRVTSRSIPPVHPMRGQRHRTWNFQKRRSLQTICLSCSQRDSLRY